MCTICQFNYEVEEEYIILPCLHRFHFECVAEWFKRKNTCPICKRKVQEGEQEEEEVASEEELVEDSYEQAFVVNRLR